VSRELVFTPAARADLEELFWFIAADDPRRARSYIAEIETGVSQPLRSTAYGT
jgi:toxin ParE1/3/4